MYLENFIQKILMNILFLRKNNNQDIRETNQKIEKSIEFLKAKFIQRVTLYVSWMNASGVAEQRFIEYFVFYFIGAVAQPFLPDELMEASFQSVS